MILFLLFVSFHLKAQEGTNPAPVAAPPGDAYLGGATTVWDDSHNAFGRALKNMEKKNWTPFRMGKSLFIAHWQAEGKDGLIGLGPLFNATSCNTCHFKDGRGRPPGDTKENLVVTLSVPHEKGTEPHPHYGIQLQDEAIPGSKAEGKLVVGWHDLPGKFPDGETYVLRRPRFQFADMSAGPLSQQTMFSVRIPPQIYGLGLLEAIPEKVLARRADPQDLNGDGISGRLHVVKDPVSGQQRMGRFGWKASKSSVKHQIVAALSQDMGVTSRILPRDPIAGGTRTVSKIEIEDYRLERLLHYVRALAVPGQRDWDKPEVRAGAVLFRSTGCADCHQPKQETGPEAVLPELANQVIYPYTDLLLHDMGTDLADGKPVGQASGKEWRTPPLWGLGHLATVNGKVQLLHDGRARNFTEAILWHGGEARNARDRFKNLSASQRGELVAFLSSL